jgi:protein involved in polysaccharide export with SLBB domain
MRKRDRSAFTVSTRREITSGAVLACLLAGSVAAPVFAQTEAPGTPVPTAPATPANPTQGAPSASNHLEGPIRKGDTLNVLVANEAALTGPQRVTAEGMISLPVAGQINVVGLMPNEAGDRIVATLKEKRLLKNPQVVVTIIGRPQPTVFVSGALERQGRVVIGEDTLLNEVLEPAGIQVTSDLKRVILMRGEQKIEINYSAYRTGNDMPDSPNNPRLKDGDKIYIPAQIPSAGSIKINGEVRTPQTTTLMTGMTVLQAVQAAGGLTEFADRDRLFVMRGGQEIEVPFKEVMEGRTSRDVVLQDKDEIFVRRLEKPKVFHVNGGVPRGGTFPLNGVVTLSDAIATAGGPLDKVDVKKIVVQRKNQNGIVMSKTYDMNKIFDASTAIQPEDVVMVPHPPHPRPRTGITEVISTISGLASMIFLFRR